ncbi:MAG TPA: T9SS type A sorting domain-containing protein [Bacteroidia bacterium]|nr:T9SS type A sorting domain-containing protein [Bacteroidia bacterium]
MKKLYLLYYLCAIFIVFGNRSYSQCPEVDYGSLGTPLEMYPFGWAGTQVFAPALWNNIGFFPGEHGEEHIAKFTPPASAAYDIDISHTFNAGGISALWRLSNGICNLNGYQSPSNYNIVEYGHFNFTLNNLTAGSDYNIILVPYDSNTTGNAALTITCGNAKNLSVSNVQSTSAVLNFNCACPNPVILEYGPAGFTPGMGTWGNGTMVANVTSPYTLTGLSPYVIYDVYLRSACGTIYSDNAKITFRTSIDCANAPVLTCGSTFTYSHTLLDNYGNWTMNCPSIANNSSEAVYRFTPSQSGMYLLTNYSGSYYTGNSIAFFYKPMGSCDTSGWNCAGAVAQHPQGVTFGPLTAGTTYLLLFDANSNAGNTIKNMRLDCVQPCTATITPSSNITICQGMTATLQANTGAGITYQWYHNGSLVAGATMSSYAASAPGGWYSVVESTPCGTVTSDYRYVYVSSAVGASVTYNTALTFCPNGYVQLNATPNYYTTTYQWQRNGANIAGATQISYQATDSGTYRVQASAAGCVAGNSNNFTVNKATSVTGFYIASSPSGICAGQNILLSLKNNQSLYPDNNPTPGYTYQWKNNGVDITGATSTTYNVTAAGSYTCLVTATCGTFTTTARVITAFTLPTVSLAANGPTTFCNSSVNLTATINGSGVSTTWKRNGVVFFTGFSQVQAASETGSYVCEVTGVCGTVVTNTINVTANKSPVLSAITGSTGFCASSAGNVYSVAPQAGVTFNWTLPTGGTVTNGQGTNSVTVSFAANAVSGNICVMGSNAACGAGIASCKSIVLRTAVSKPGVITGLTNACRQSAVYSIKKVPNAEYYTWNPPAGAKVNGSAATLQTPDTIVVLQFDSTFTGDTLRVKAVNCTGTSAVRKLRINNNPPAVPGPISGSVYANCNTSGTYSINPVANAVSYTWRTTVPGATIYGSSLPYTTPAASIVVNFTNGLSGKVYVKANSLCNSSAEKALSVYSKPAAPASITGPATVCDSALQVNYTTPVISGAATYNWTVMTGSTIAGGQGTNSINVNFEGTAATGNIKVRAQNVCANSGYFSKAVTINNCNRLMSEGAKAELQLYPNPFTSTATLTIPAETDLDASEVIIYNVMGKQVRVISKIENYTLEIERKNLPPGMYFIKLISGGIENGIVKMIVE